MFFILYLYVNYMSFNVIICNNYDRWNDRLKRYESRKKGVKETVSGITYYMFAFWNNDKIRWNDTKIRQKQNRFKKWKAANSKTIKLENKKRNEKSQGAQSWNYFFSTRKHSHVSACNRMCPCKIMFVCKHQLTSMYSSHSTNHTSYRDHVEIIQRSCRDHSEIIRDKWHK